MIKLDELIKELDCKLGDERQFYTISELTSIGFFGSLPGARIALKNGLFPYIQPSKRRCLIPRLVLIEFLRSNLKIGGHQRPLKNGAKHNGNTTY